MLTAASLTTWKLQFFVIRDSVYPTLQEFSFACSKDYLQKEGKLIQNASSKDHSEEFYGHGGLLARHEARSTL